MIGTGKTLLMDIFYDSLPTPFKIRRHYDHFLLSLYHKTFQHMENKRLSLDLEEVAQNDLARSSGGKQGYHASRREEAKAKALTRGWTSVFAGGRALDDPALKKEFVLACIARDMFLNQGWLLAFDEVQMVDVAGASILRRVLEYYWRFGGVIVATSNRLPDGASHTLILLPLASA